MSSVAELDTAPKADFDTAAKVESFLCRSVLLQEGHAGAALELRTSVSKSLAQEPHLNSKMGMVCGRRRRTRTVYDSRCFRWPNEANLCVSIKRRVSSLNER